MLIQRRLKSFCQVERMPTEQSNTKHYMQDLKERETEDHTTMDDSIRK